VNSESSSLFFNNPSVERQLCIVNRGFTIVTEQVQSVPTSSMELVRDDASC
jgi:hypothetical protein